MFELSVGSKVFLFGEYQVLKEGTAFLVVIEPRFRMLVKSGKGELEGVASGSPAWVYHQQEFEFFKDWDLEFIDPHQGRGGFGASTAQIGLLQGFREGSKSIQAHSQVEFDLKKIHQKYLELVKPSSGPSPSGADLLCQFQGGLVELDIKSGKIQKKAWPFSDVQIYFFSTGKKQLTHEHLTKLSVLNDPNDNSLYDLCQIYKNAVISFQLIEKENFINAVIQYQKELAKRGWVTSETLSWLIEVNKIDGVLAAKGCGAMGADVIAVFAEVNHGENLIRSVEQLGLSYRGSLDQRTEGFAFKWTENEF